MHELIEGFTGVEVVADDFVVIGFGDTGKEAGADHDKNLAELLSKCEQSNVKLNPDKVKFKQDTVLFIPFGHKGRFVCRSRVGTSSTGNADAKRCHSSTTSVGFYSIS